MVFFHSLPVPELREWVFSIPFPFPNFGNGIIHSRSRSRTPKCHSRSPLHQNALPGEGGSIYHKYHWPLLIFVDIWYIVLNFIWCYWYFGLIIISYLLIFLSQNLLIFLGILVLISFDISWYFGLNSFWYLLIIWSQYRFILVNILVSIFVDIVASIFVDILASIFVDILVSISGCRQGYAKLSWVSELGDTLAHSQFSNQTTFES